MANNSTNIKKTNSHLSPQSIEQKRPWNVNPGPGLEQAPKCGGVNRLMGFPLQQYRYKHTIKNLHRFTRLWQLYKNHDV